MDISLPYPNELNDYVNYSVLLQFACMFACICLSCWTHDDYMTLAACKYIICLHATLILTNHTFMYYTCITAIHCMPAWLNYTFVFLSTWFNHHLIWPNKTCKLYNVQTRSLLKYLMHLLFNFYCLTVYLLLDFLWNNFDKIVT